MLAIIGASGKIGGATLSAILAEKLLPADGILCTTSAQSGDSKWRTLSEKGVQVRHASFDNQSSMEEALTGCDKLFLVSSPRIQMDFYDAPPGKGREKDHYVAIEAARKAGVKHIYYTSLAFRNPSKSNVMTAHERTEEYLSKLTDIKITIIREGLYNESWPLYFGHYDPKGDDRSVVLVAGDSPISWTSIPDLGLANAIVVTANSEEYAGKTLYLSNTRSSTTLKEIADIVSRVKGNKVELQVVDRTEHEEHYIQERNMDEGNVRWWAKTYDAIRDEECLIKEDAFEQLLNSIGRTPKPIDETVKEMISSV